MNAGDDPRVRQQYERYPYPERTAADEKTRLVSTWLDELRIWATAATSPNRSRGPARLSRSTGRRCGVPSTPG